MELLCAAVDGGTADTRPSERWVLDHLPAGVLVIDETGLIVAGSERAAALVSRRLDEFIGSSILEYVDPDAVWAYAAAMNVAIDSTFAHTYGGPVRIAVQSPDGRKVAADVWSSNEIGGDGPQAMVLLLTEQTTALGIAEAVGLAGTGASYAEVAAMTIVALGGFPVIADAAVLEMAGDGFTVVAGNVPTSLVDGTAGDEPWRRAIDERQRVLYPTTDSIPAPLGDLLAAAGYRALWVEPITANGDATTGLVAVFRRLPGEPTSNELANVHQVAAVLGLAPRA